VDYLEVARRFFQALNADIRSSEFSRQASSAFSAYEELRKKWPTVPKHRQEMLEDLHRQLEKKIEEARKKPEEE